MEATTWLLEGPPWVRYRTRLDLLNQGEEDSPVQSDRLAILSDPRVQGLLADLAQWPGQVLNNHKDAGHALHKLTFVADVGLQAGDPGMDRIIARVLEHRAADGPFQVLVNIPTHFGGTGQEQWSWMLCDAPVVLHALVRFNVAQDPRVQAGVEHLAGLVRENGWPCAASSDLGRFHGPGRRDDPCPYANLVMLRLLASLPGWRDSPAARSGAETLLTLWERSLEFHPYLFHMGTDFRKLKAPLIWYDVLHVLDVLSRFPWLHEDGRLREMATLVRAKADAQGHFTPESVWKAWGEWEFGQKKVPSRWLTLLAWRALQRLGAA